jgi:hypothetical protein
MSRQVKQWKARLRQIKSELSPELRAAAKRMQQAVRSHGHIKQSSQSVSAIRHGLMKKEQGRG